MPIGPGGVWIPKASGYRSGYNPYKQTGNGAGNPFEVGVRGPSGGMGAFGTGGGGWGAGGGEQGPSFGQMRDVFNQTVGDVRGQLTGGADLQRFGALGGAVQQGVLNPQGFGEGIMTQARTRNAEREAGLRESILRGLQNRSAATGFSRSASAMDVGQNIRGASAQRLSDADLQLQMEDARLKRSSQADMLRAALGLTGEERGYRSQLADFFAQVQRPVGGGGGGSEGGLPGAAQGYRFINERGEPLPFHPDGTPLTDMERQIALQERQAWLNENGGNV